MEALILVERRKDFLDFKPGFNLGLKFFLVKRLLDPDDDRELSFIELDFLGDLIGCPERGEWYLDLVDVLLPESTAGLLNSNPKLVGLKALLDLVRELKGGRQLFLRGTLVEDVAD